MSDNPSNNGLCEWTPGGRIPLDNLLKKLDEFREKGQRIVSTNGCYDLLHTGHLFSLQAARALGDVLIVGLNSDASVGRLKGAGRPILCEDDRAAMLAALRCVDHVVLFDDLLPNRFLEQIRPDLHCKAGDYSVESMPEAEVVQRNGGQIHILPTLPGYSTTRLVQQLQAALSAGESGSNSRTEDEIAAISEQLFAGSNLLRQIAYRLSGLIAQAASLMVAALQSGHKILVCGNGGSAAAELVERFQRDRQPWPTIALITDSSSIPALSNDSGFAQVFARQVQALGNPGDVLLALSTSGAAPTILNAAQAARDQGLAVISLSGEAPSSLSKLSDIHLAIPSTHTPYIQIAHSAILHVLCERIETILDHEH